MSKTGELLGRLLLWGILFLVGAAVGLVWFARFFSLYIEDYSTSSADQPATTDESRRSPGSTTLLGFVLVCGAGAVALYELHDYEKRRRQPFRSRVTRRSKPSEDVWDDIGNGEARE